MAPAHSCLAFHVYSPTRVNFELPLFTGFHSPVHTHWNLEVFCPSCGDYQVLEEYENWPCRLRTGPGLTLALQDLKDFARRSALDVVYSEIGRERDGRG